MNSRKILSAALLICSIALLLFFFSHVNGSGRSARPIGHAVVLAVPLGLTEVRFPADNPPTAETIALGRRLYYDKALSRDGSISCASCHDAERGFADPRTVSVGVGGKLGTRNSPAVANAAYYATQFWDGRAANLEKQSEGPVQNPVEMAHTLQGVEDALNANASYREQFAKAFGPGRITYEMVEKSIASFERTVLVGDSPFDRWYFGHQQNAISDSAKRGFEVFKRADKGNCAACHTFSDSNPLFTDNQFHNLGVGVGDDFMPKDLGRYAVTRIEADKGAFKTPILRNVALTAPYMHDGSLRTLKDVVDFYVGGGNSNPYRDPKMKELSYLTAQDKADLIEFLKALTGQLPENVGPPPSASQRASK